MLKNDNTQRGANVAEELLVLGEELLRELQILSIEAQDVKRLLQYARTALNGGNVAMATVKATDACTLAEQRKSEGIIQIVGKKVSDIKDFLTSTDSDSEMREVREYLASGEDALILGHYDEANKFLDNAIKKISELRGQWDHKMTSELIVKAESCLDEEKIPDTDGKLRMMVHESSELLSMGDREEAQKRVMEVLSIFSEETKLNETQTLTNELRSVEEDITQLEKLGAEVKALRRRYSDGTEALEREDIDETRGIITNCYQIIGRLKDRVRIKAAQERLAKAKYVVDQVREIEIDMYPLEERLEKAKRLFRGKEYAESIDVSDKVIDETLSIRDDYYHERVTTKLEELRENIAQLEDGGLVLDRQKRTLELVAGNVGKKRYFECENLLENVSLELLKEKNEMRIKKASSDIAGIQADINKLKTLRLDPGEVEGILESALTAFNSYNYHETGDLAGEARKKTYEMITKYRLDEGGKEYDRTETWMMDLSKEVDVSGSWVMFNEGREHLSRGDYKEANRMLRRVREKLESVWESDINKKIGDMKKKTYEIRNDLKERGLKTLKAEKLMRMAELKLQANNMDEGFRLVREAYESARQTKNDFLMTRYLDMLLDYHSKLKALSRAGLDVTDLTDELAEAKKRVEEHDFDELDGLMVTILDSINEKKGEYVKGLSRKRLNALLELIAEYDDTGMDIEDIGKIARKASSTHESGDYDTARELIEEANDKLRHRYESMKTDSLRNGLVDIREKIEIWREGSGDTVSLEVVLDDAEKDLDAGELEKASDAMDRATELANELESAYQQNKVLDVISEMKIAFRELAEKGLDIGDFNEQMETIKAHFTEMRYGDAYELSMTLKDGVRSMERHTALSSRKQSLIKRYVELEKEGLDVSREGERFSYVDTLLAKEEFDSAEVILDKLSGEMETRYVEFKRDYFNDELEEFDRLLEKFRRKGMEMSSLLSLSEKTREHLDNGEFDVAANHLKVGWKEAEAARDFYMTNKLLGQLYDLEDALFELANQGANVKELDGGLIKIKKLISQGSFEEAKKKIEEMRMSIAEVEREFYRAQYREVLEDIEHQQADLEEKGVDTSEMKELVEVIKQSIDEGRFKDAERAFEKLRKRRDSLELGHKVVNSKKMLENVQREIERLREKGIIVDLMRDLYKDAQGLLDRNNFSEVEAYCKLAVKEGRMREREHDTTEAKERLYRTRNVIEFIGRDSDGTVDLSDLYPRLHRLRERIEEEIDEEVLESISQLEEDVRRTSHEYMEKKAVATKKLLDDMINDIDEMGGISSPLYTFVQKGNKLLEKEHYGPSIEWFQKGIEKAAMEKKRREIKKAMESLGDMVRKAKDIGVNVTAARDILDEGRRAFKKDDLDDSWELLEKAKSNIEKARRNFQEAKVKNILITSNVIYDELLKMEVEPEKLETDRNLLDDVRRLLKIGDLDNAEENVMTAKKRLVRSKSFYNLKTIREELGKTMDACATIEEEGVEISSSLQILGEANVFLGDKTSLTDEEYRSTMDEIRHARRSARKQEKLFRIHLLKNNLERTEALLMKHEMEGADMAEPKEMLSEVKKLQKGGRIDQGLARIEECSCLAKSIRSEFFMESADGLMYTSGLLMEEIRNMNTDIRHLDALMKEAREHYENREYRKSAHLLKSIISACDEVTAIGKVQYKADKLMDAIYNSPVDSDLFEEGLKKIRDLLGKGDYENAETTYAALARSYNETMNTHEYGEARREIAERELAVRELGSDGIRQARALTLIEHSKKYLEEGELDNAREIAGKAVEMAVQIREDRINSIHEAVLLAEKALFEKEERAQARKEYVDELDRIMEETRSVEKPDLTRTMIGLSIFLGTLESETVKSRIRDRSNELHSVVKGMETYVPDEAIEGLLGRLDGVMIPGPRIPVSEDSTLFDTLDGTWEDILDISEQALGGILNVVDDTVEEHGGDEGILSGRVPGLHTYNIYVGALRETNEKEVLRRLRLATLVREEIETMALHAVRQDIIGEMEKLREKISTMETEDFSPSSAKHWLEESAKAMGAGDFKEANKCLRRAGEGADNARKRYEQEKSSRKITDTIKRMKKSGLKFSEAEDVQLWLKKAQIAERNRQFPLIDELCGEALKAAEAHIENKKKMKLAAEIERVEAAINSEKREIEPDPHLRKLDIARGYAERNNIQLAREIAGSAEREMRDMYWLSMLDKLVEKYEEVEGLKGDAKAREIDISEVDIVIMESKIFFLKDAQALALEKVNEACALARELTLKNMIRGIQDELTVWRNEMEELEKKGCDVADLQRQVDELLDNLKRGNLEDSKEIKKKLQDSLKNARKSMFRDEIKGRLDKCDVVMEEVASMKGDTDAARSSVRRAMEYLDGELLESASELSQSCLEGLVEQRNVLLRERASTVLYAAGEIVKDASNDKATEYYIKARKAFKLERYQEALAMARESMKYM